jgi:hypothetical protein
MASTTTIAPAAAWSVTWSAVASRLTRSPAAPDPLSILVPAARKTKTKTAAGKNIYKVTAGYIKDKAAAERPAAPSIDSAKSKATNGATGKEFLALCRSERGLEPHGPPHGPPSSLLIQIGDDDECSKFYCCCKGPRNNEQPPSQEESVGDAP